MSVAMDVPRRTVMITSATIDVGYLRRVEKIFLTFLIVHPPCRASRVDR